jgi:hypothetical protein
MAENDIEVKAKELGWAPKEDFKGDPEKWVDAETFVRRGEEIMPLLKANNRKLSQEVAGLKQKLEKTETLLVSATESIEALKEFNTEIRLERAKSQDKELSEAIKEAREAEDEDKLEELREQRSEVRKAIKEAEAAPKVKEPKGEAKPPAEEPDPEFVEWAKENDWFMKDKRRTALALAIGQELKEKDPDLKGKKFLDAVTEEVDKTLGGGEQPRQSKVEGSGRGGEGGGGGSGKRTFSDLPEEAKAACERLGERLVGEGRAYKTKKDWRDNYVAKYYGA